MAPPISVVMATFNHAEYLREAVDSVLAQTFKDFEFIIIDDASTDSTPAILDGYKDARIVRFRNDSNKKLATSLNYGLHAAQGEYFVRMDSDDYAHPERFAKQIAYMDSHPDIGVLGTSYSELDAAARFGRHVDQPTSHGLIVWNYLSRMAYPLLHGTIFARRDLFVAAGGYNTAFPREQDGELFLRLIDSAKYANLPDYLYSRRYTRSSRSAEKLVSSGYPLTLEIRRNCLSGVLERPVTAEEAKTVIFPPKAIHRQVLGIELTVKHMQTSISILIETMDMLSRKGFLTDDDRRQLRANFADLVMHNLALSQPFFEVSSRSFSLATLSRLAGARIVQRLASPGSLIYHVKKKLRK